MEGDLMASRFADARSVVAVVAVLALIGLAACAAEGTQDTAEERVIDIGIDGYHFVPDHFAVHEGESIRFEVNNPDDIGHELYIGTIAEQAARRAAMPTAPDVDAGTHFGYGLYLPAMTRGTFTYHFSDDTDLLIGCHLPGHWEAGMVATVEVEPSP